MRPPAAIVVSEKAGFGISSEKRLLDRENFEKLTLMRLQRLVGSAFPDFRTILLFEGVSR